MTLEVLLSCMHQKDFSLVEASRLTGDVLIINQCDREDFAQVPTKTGTARMFSTRERGLTRSRNMAISKSAADVCLLCDDDEVFVPDYEKIITEAYEMLPKADMIVFNMTNRPASLGNRVRQLHFPYTCRVSSWQISFRRQSLLRSGVRFDTLLGAGTGNGGEEELKFLTDCRRAGLSIYYVPEAIASVAQEVSTWFHGYTQTYFENRGATTRYILGLPLALVYAAYYAVSKRSLYTLSPWQAFKATCRGMKGNRIGKLARSLPGKAGD